MSFTSRVTKRTSSCEDFTLPLTPIAAGPRRASCGDHAVTRHRYASESSTASTSSTTSSQLPPLLEIQSYSDVIVDTAEMLSPLTRDKFLQSEFIAVLQKPRRDLRRLSSELQALQERLESGFGMAVSETAFPELLAQLSTLTPCALDQVKALGIATNAFRDLAPISVDRILKLTIEEKRNLFLLFKTIPVVSSMHGFSTVVIAKEDNLYEQLLTRIGFSDWRGRLVYEKETGDSGLDKITLTIIAIQSISA